MAFTFIRELNEHERETIDKMIARNLRGPIQAFINSPKGCLATLIVFALIVLVIWGPKAMLLFFLVVVFGGIIMLIAGELYERKKRPEIDKRLREILDDNRVEVARFEDVVPVADEHPGIYLFDIGNDRVLMIPDPETCPISIEYNQWPNNCFEIVKTVKYGLWLGIYCYGEKVNFKYEKGIYGYAKGELPEWILRIFENYRLGFPSIHNKHSNGEPIGMLEGKGWREFANEI